MSFVQIHLFVWIFGWNMNARKLNFLYLTQCFANLCINIKKCLNFEIQLDPYFDLFIKQLQIVRIVISDMR